MGWQPQRTLARLAYLSNQALSAYLLRFVARTFFSALWHYHLQDELQIISSET